MEVPVEHVGHHLDFGLCRGNLLLRRRLRLCAEEEGHLGLDGLDRLIDRRDSLASSETGLMFSLCCSLRVGIDEVGNFYLLLLARTDIPFFCLRTCFKIRKVQAKVSFPVPFCWIGCLNVSSQDSL